jgi:hypothetical protein
MNNDMRPKFGPTPEAPESLERVESHCYPVFVQPILCPDDPQRVVGLDGWCVSPTHNWADDFEMGRWHADDAIFFSRLLGPGFLAFVLNSLVCKGGRNYSGLEYGFIERIAESARAGGMN